MTAPPWLTERPIAHRGLHDRSAGRAENTISAAEAAIRSGFAIECDIQVSSDGEAMVFHDHVLDRLTDERGPVRECRAAYLGRMAIAGTQDRIPTLAGFLDRIGARTPVVIEVKSRFDGDERLARRLVEVVDGRAAPIAVKSFDPGIVSLLRRIAPHLTRGVVAQSSYDEAEWTAIEPSLRHAMANLLHWSETAPDFLSWRHRDLPVAAPFLSRALAGTPVVTWTIRSPRDAEQARHHADQIVFEGFLPG